MQLSSSAEVCIEDDGVGALSKTGALEFSTQQFDWRCLSPMNSTGFSGFCPHQFLYMRHLEQSFYNEALVVFVN